MPTDSRKPETGHIDTFAGAGQIVYVREADPDRLPEHLRAAPGKIYALHDVAGNQVALAPDRRLAFALARRNDLTPISVH